MTHPTPTALLGMIKTNPHDHSLYLLKLSEFRALAEAAGYRVCGVVIQVRLKESVNYAFGRGKVEEIKEVVKAKGVDVFAVYNILTSKQKYNLEKALGVRVLDRYELTLEIFDKASSDELSKLQIELARLMKLYPYEKLRAAMRYRIGREHPWLKSSGEYVYHSIVSSLRHRMARVRDKLEDRKRVRIEQIVKRHRLGSPIVCIAGYYSSGKTTLFNALTGLSKPVSPKPFTTLSSKYYLINGFKGLVKDVFVVDTIGFVHDLDPKMLEAFELTLNDIRFSDLVLLVVDCSDPEPIMMLRLSTCLDILRDLGVDNERVVVALNKIDLVNGDELAWRLNLVANRVNPAPVIPISAKKGINLDLLVASALSRLQTLTSLKGQPPQPDAINHPEVNMNAERLKHR